MRFCAMAAFYFLKGSTIMTTSLFATLLSFLSTNASGVLAGVVGAKISAWIAGHLKTQTEQALYTDLLLPLFQSLAGLLQGVSTAPVTVTPAAAATVAVPATATVAVAATAPTQPASATVSIPVYNQD
jgi:hypothetical protein